MRGGGSRIAALRASIQATEKRRGFPPAAIRQFQFPGYTDILIRVNEFFEPVAGVAGEDSIRSTWRRTCRGQ
jgi:hypothetical protein